MDKRLKIAIVEKGIRQIDIAREAEIQESKLSKIINRHIEPSMIEKRKISSVLGIDQSSLWSEEIIP